jgi:hypothetical protein
MPEASIESNACATALTNIWLPLQVYGQAGDLVWEGNLSVTRLASGKNHRHGCYIPRNVQGKIVVGDAKLQFEK